MPALQMGQQFINAILREPEMRTQNGQLTTNNHEINNLRRKQKMITIDLDTESFWRVKLACWTLSKLPVNNDFPTKNVLVEYRKSSQKGYHVRAYGLNNNYFIRWILGDDPKRIRVDKDRERREVPINVLFTQKRFIDGTVKKSGDWINYSGRKTQNKNRRKTK
jgi:hypothetical protein